MNNKSLVSIIVANYNGQKWLNDFFTSIYNQSYPYFEVIFIDNASTDESVKFVKKNYSQVTVIQNRENVGFGRANNQGVEKANGEIIFFLNNDTILKKDVLRRLVVYKKNRRLNILGPRILTYKGEDIHQDKMLSIDLTGYIGYGGKTFYVDGCALMIGKRDFTYLGGFDEKYFMYSEEIDLCWRAHLYGMKVGVCHETSIKHLAGGTGGSTLFNEREKHEVPLRRRYEVEKNNLRNLLKNYELINLLWVIPLFELQSLGESLVYFITGNFTAFTAIWRANLWNLLNISDTLRQRRIIQKKRVVGDRKILSMMFFGLNKFLAFRSIGLPKFR